MSTQIATRLIAPVLLGLQFCFPAQSFGQNDKRSQMDYLSKQILLPDFEEVLAPADVNLDAERIEFANAKGHLLRGWYVQTKGAEKTILVCPGNAGTVSMYLPYANVFAKGGFNVMIFHYQGFGTSEGVPSIFSLQGDVDAAFEYLTEVRQVPVENVGVFGVSLGSVLSYYIAARQKIGALAVEDSFIPSELVDRFFQGNQPAFLGMALKTTLAGILPNVDPIANISKIQCPIFMLHGERDRLLPTIATLKIAARTVSPLRVWVMQGVGHAPESLEVNDREYAHQLQRFFQDALDGTEATFAQDPEFRITNVNEEDNSTGSLFHVSLEGNAPKDKYLEICLMSEKGVCQVFRRVSEGECKLEVNTAFRPKFVTAIACKHAVSKDETWVPDLSKLSNERKRYLKVRGAIYSDLAKLYRKKLDQKSVPSSSERWLMVEEQLPPVEDIHPHLKPLYASLIASCIAGYEDEADEKLLPAWSKLESLLPSEPATHYYLGDAYFYLGYRDPNVANRLLDWAKYEINNSRTTDAKRLLEQVRQIHPKGDAIQAEDIAQVDSIETLEKLIEPLMPPKKVLQ